MGYRSEVMIALAMPNADHMTELMAAYAILPEVQEHDLLKVWNVTDAGYAGMTIVWFYEEYIKWYGDADDIRAILALKTLAGDFNESRGFEFAYYLLRIGEEDDDIETDTDQTDDGSDAMEALYNVMGISRSIQNTLKDGD